jgi:YHS domain-containing protein
MSALLWFVRVLVILFVIRLIVSFLRGTLTAGRTPTTRRRPSGPPERVGGKLVRDPECGTYIPEERAVKYGRGDQTQFFCSVACRDKWLARNERRAASE